MDELNLYSASSLTQQSTDRHVAPLVHMILLSQSVFHRAPYSCVRSGESTNTNYSAARLICTILLYVCVIDTYIWSPYQENSRRKFKEDNLFSYILIYGVTIIFLKFPTAIYLVTKPYMVSRTYTYNKIVQINLAAE